MDCPPPAPIEDSTLNTIKTARLLHALGLAAMLAIPASAREPLPAANLSSIGVPGVEPAQLDPAFWLARLDAADRLVLDADAIAAQNFRLLRDDKSMYRLEQMPETLARADVRKWIEAISRRPEAPRFDAAGTQVSAGAFDAMAGNLALGAIAETQATRFGLAVRRAALRRFPSALPMFSRTDDLDIDHFEESALFPGTPVAIAHRSADGQWLFVVSPHYAAWVAADAVAEGERGQVFGYVERAAAGRVVTGAKLHTVYTREAPRVSELQLDMGVRLPVLPTPAEAQVNGQHPYTSWIIELPVRASDGRLEFAPALVQRIADTSPNPLPLTRANLVRQAFKFLGERYGWGHRFNGRDCSGFVSEVYQSMGVLLPRNSSDQARSPALRRTALGKDATPAERRAAVDALQVGDLIHIPGHVMMMLGRIDGRPYVIHDINGGSFADGQGGLRPLHLNAVSITPLEPLQFDADRSYLDSITSIVHLRP